MTGPAPHVTVFGSVPAAAPWLTEHNLAAALSRRADVAWVDPPHSPVTMVRERRRGAAPVPTAELAAIVRRRPVVLPPIDNDVARRASVPLVRAQVRAVVGPQRTVLLARSPGCAVESLKARRSVYLVKDWNPAGAALLGRRTAQEIERAMVELCQEVDLVCAVTERLRQTLAERGIESRLLRHGFAAETAPDYENPPPDALADLPRPLVGYVGRVDDRLDADALVQLARRIHPGTVALFGPVSPRMSATTSAQLRGEPNIVLGGTLPRAQVGSALAALDCCLLPYRVGEWGAHGSPLKLWEYLYAGPPIVGSGYEVLEEYAPHVAYVRPESLADAVADALSSTPGAAVGDRRAFALANSWDERAEQLLRMTEADGEA